MKQDQKHRVEELVTHLARECAQTMPESRLSNSAANGITGVVRLFS